MDVRSAYEVTANAKMTRKHSASLSILLLGQEVVMESLFHRLFGWQYICFRWGCSEIVRRVKVWPNGRKTVTAYEEVAILDEETKRLSTGRKYIELT